MIYIFDVDGTLTPARGPIEAEFKHFFFNWIQNKKVYFISGSDYPKSVEQVGAKLCEAVLGCYNTAGNTFYRKGKLIYKNEWDPPRDLVELLNKFLKDSSFPYRRGNHLEFRIGMLNFSIVGRNCTREERNEYNQYDNDVHEREKFQEMIMDQFPDIEVSIGGQISIDIYPQGRNKGQIVRQFTEPIYFFGDKTQPGGNDYDLAKELQYEPHKVFQVDDWQHTWKILSKDINQ
jgi:phosphomannomutase